LVISHSPNAWSHRKWVCKQILKGSDIESICQFAKHEISKCCEIAEKKPKNYYAWTHRLYIVQSLAGMVADADADADADAEYWHPNSVSRLTSEYETTKSYIWNILEEEVKSIEPWLKKHVSDHSAAHYGGQVLRLWLDCGSMHFPYKTASTCAAAAAATRADTSTRDGNFRIMEQVKILQDIMGTCSALIESFPSHEVIWIWRRICSQILVEFVMTLYSNPLCSSEEKGILSAVMIQFVKSEILVIYDGFETEYSTSQDECQSNQHSVTYILWILKQFHKHKCFQLIADELQLNQICSKLKCFLENSDQTSSNMWEAIRNTRYTYPF
jgi:protein prenyltransferase alpha subunit repeat containing protein 1